MSTVSIVIVNWNAADVLPACLETIDIQRGIDVAEVIVVDNASSDESVAVVKTAAKEVRYPLSVIENEDNRGFGAANNQGGRAASGELLLLLNPDTEFEGSDSLAILAHALDDPGVGLAGPHLLNTDGTTQGSCASFPSVGHSLVMATGAHKVLPQAMLMRVAAEQWKQDRSTDTDWLRGACLMFRRDEFLELGGFSEATFMYGEDLEIAYEIRESGKRVRFCHESKLRHHDDYSANKRWSTPERVKRVGRGTLMFLERHYAWPRRNAIRIVDFSGYATRWLIHSIRRDRRAQTYRALMSVYRRGSA